MVLSQHMPVRTKENMKNFSQDCWSLDSDLNQRSPEYKAHVITTQLAYSSLTDDRRLYLILSV
jgi:hypothetical protein